MLQTALEQQLDQESLESQVQSVKPEAKWQCHIKNQQYGLTISFYNQKNTISGTLSIHKDGSRMIYIDIFNVDQKFRRMGIGTRLMKSLVSEAISYGATTLSGHVVSDSALRLRAKVFGEENLQLYDHWTGEKTDLSFQQILQEKLPVDVVVDLTKIDTSNWERPISP